MFYLFTTAERVIKGMFGVSDDRERNRLLGELAALDTRLRGSLAGVALSRNFNWLVGRIMLQEPGKTGYRNRFCILVAFENLQAGIAVSACRPGRTFRTADDCRCRLQPWAVAHCHGNGVRQGEGSAIGRRSGRYASGYLGKRR